MAAADGLGTIRRLHLARFEGEARSVVDSFCKMTYLLFSSWRVAERTDRSLEWLGNSGAGDVTRTRDLLITNPNRAVHGTPVGVSALRKRLLRVRRVRLILDASERLGVSVGVRLLAPVPLG